MPVAFLFLSFFFNNSDFSPPLPPKKEQQWRGYKGILETKTDMFDSEFGTLYDGRGRHFHRHGSEKNMVLNFIPLCHSIGMGQKKQQPDIQDHDATLNRD